jgi:hypothetical protein
VLPVSAKKNPLDCSNGLDIFLKYNNTFLPRPSDRVKMMVCIAIDHNGVKVELIFNPQKYYTI